MVLQCSKLFHWKICTGLLPQFLQNTHSFGKIQKVGGLEFFEEKNIVFHWRNLSYFIFKYISVSGISMQSFCSGSELIRSYCPPRWSFLFVCYCFFFLMVMQPHIIYNCFIEVSIDDILSQMFIIMHTYRHTYIHKHTRKLKYMQFCLYYTIAVIWW